MCDRLQCLNHLAELGVSLALSLIMASRQRLIFNLNMAVFIGDGSNNTLPGTAENDVIFGLTGNDRLLGNQGNDFVFGGQGEDIVYGGQGNDGVFGDRGNDILYGDLGENTLTGGSGRDVFVIQSANTVATEQLITDFVDGEDVLGLSGLAFTNIRISSDGNSTLIQESITGQILARLPGINASQITQADFTQSLTPIPSSPTATTLVNGIASGDTDQTSTILWAGSTALGEVSFEYGTDASFNTILGMLSATVIDPNVPVKAGLAGLTPGTQYYYRVTDALGDRQIGQFRTPNSPGTREGLRFGVSGDLKGELAPFVSIGNADDRNLDFFVQMGDTIEADSESPALPGITQAKTLEQFRAKHNEVYSPRFDFNPWKDLRATTSVYATWDDHDVTNDFAGGATPADSPQKQNLFGTSSSGFVNKTSAFNSALQAFQDYFPLREDQFYGNTGDALTTNRRKLYRYNTFGSDAATFVLDVRSFRDAPLPFVSESASQEQLNQQLTDAFARDRTMLGAAQLEQFKADLLAAEQSGVTWKFVMSTVPMQHFGIPVMGERWEGYAAERADLLNFIEQNQIKNVVFITGDFHGSVVNNVTNQQGPGQPVTPTGVFDVMIGPVGIELTVPFLPEPFNQTFAAPFGPATVGFTPESLLEQQGKTQAQYLALGDNRAARDQFVREVVDFRTQGLLGYDPIGLEGSPINAQLLQGEYLATHTYGWSEFEIAPETGQLTVTTYGVPPYTQTDLLANPNAILTPPPEIVSQFQVTPV